MHQFGVFHSRESRAAEEPVTWLIGEEVEEMNRFGVSHGKVLGIIERHERYTRGLELMQQL
jgi:hypothetical protein